MKDKSTSNNDKATLEAIGSIYCKAHHAGGARNDAGLCSACALVVDYALTRTEACPYGHEGNCQDCSLHCFNKDMRADVQQMMRYAAPRMFVRHPLMSLEYLRKKRNKRK